MNLEYIGHQKLAQIEAEVEAKMAEVYVRLDWMKPDPEPFEIKAFVLEQLGLIHGVMCENDIHAPDPLGALGHPITNCPYCDYEGTVLGAESILR